MVDITALFHEHPERVRVLHYACGSLSDNLDVSCISVWDYARGRTYTFARTAAIEEESLLSDFVEYLKANQGVVFVVWNGVDTTYGLPAIARQVRTKLGVHPLPGGEHDLVDLDHEFERVFGESYAPHRKLTNMMKFNGIKDLDFLEGPEEAAAQKAANWKIIENSTNRKVKVIDDLLRKFVDGSLKVPNPGQIHYKVFVCYNNSDFEAVNDIASALRHKRVMPWIDKADLRPGTKWQKELEAMIGTVPAVAVFVGPSGIGPWQENEVEAALMAAAKSTTKVIPVILPGVNGTPQLPAFLKAHQWVDWRVGDPDPLQQLIWGITGQK